MMGWVVMANRDGEAGRENRRDAVAARRGRLAVVANPAPWHDYLVRWTMAMASGTRLVIDSVPDRWILTPTALTAYLATLEAESWPTLEGLAVTVLDDLNNELVPRWVQVTIWGRQGAIRQCALADDRQPDWDNPGLLARLEPAFRGR